MTSASSVRCINNNEDSNYVLTKLTRWNLDGETAEECKYAKQQKTVNALNLQIFLYNDNK